MEDELEFNVDPWEVFYFPTAEEEEELRNLELEQYFEEQYYLKCYEKGIKDESNRG